MILKLEIFQSDLFYKIQYIMYLFKLLKTFNLHISPHPSKNHFVNSIE